MAGLLENLLMMPQSGGFLPVPLGIPEEELTAERAREVAAERLRQQVIGGARRAPPMIGDQGGLPFGMAGIPEWATGADGVAPDAGAPQGGINEFADVPAPPAGLNEFAGVPENIPLPQERPTDLGVDSPNLPPNARTAQGQSVPFSMAPQGGGGLGGMFGKLLDPANAPLLLALGAGFAGAPSLGTGMRRGFSNAVAPAALLRREQVGLQTQAQTYQALLAKGVPPQEAMAALRSPELMKALVTKYFETKSPINVNGTLVREQPDGSVRELGTFGDAKNPVIQEFSEVDPKTGQVLNIKKQLNRKTGAWEVIPGHDKPYPADARQAEKLDTATAGRLALMQEAAIELPSARKILMQGRGSTGTGVSGTAAAYTNIGDTGRAQRTVRTAIEGVLRAMTGAAAPEKEVVRYENMFLPSPFDSPKTAAQKLDQLEGFIDRATKLIMRGRGGPEALKQALGDVAVPSGGGAAGAGGTTKSGVKWSVE